MINLGSEPSDSFLGGSKNSGALATTPKTTVTLRQTLMHHTHTAHEALHVHPRITPLVGPHLSQEHYHTLLRDYLIFHRATEAKRNKNAWWPALSLDIQIQALERDLDTILTSPLSPSSYQPLLANDMECLGALYVLIGAQFGGQVIGAQIKKNLPDEDCSYFSRNSQTVDQWKTLLALLEAVPQHGSSRGSVLDGAQQTFFAFANHLSRISPPST